MGVARAGCPRQEVSLLLLHYTTIAAIADTVRDHEIGPGDIESIDVSISKGVIDALKHDDPKSGLQAKFSLPYTAAYAVVHHDVGLEAFDERGLDDEEVRTVQDSVTYSVNNSLTYDDHTATIRIKTTEGGIIERTLEDPPGTHNKPLSDRELHQKFRMCVTRVMDAERADRLLERLAKLRGEASVSDLAASL